MLYRLCGSHLPSELSFRDELNRKCASGAVGITTYGPVRIIEADSEEDAKDAFLDLYRDYFNAIKRFDTGYVHIVEA